VRKDSFFSDGLRLAARLYRPEGAGDGRRLPGIVVAHGFGGTMRFRTPEIAQSFAAAGFLTLIFDYRGFGESEGHRYRLLPLEQVEDLLAAVTFLAAQPEVDPERLGLFGISFGAAHVIVAGARDRRVKAVASGGGFGDGARFLRSQRPYWQWVELLKRLEADRTRRALTGQGAWVDSGEILVRDPLSQAFYEERVRQFPDTAYQLPLETAQRIIEYRPEDYVGRLAPRPFLVYHAGEDILVSVEEAESLFAKAGDPKRLLIFPGLAHHDVYAASGQEKMLGAVTTFFREALGT
jgi:dipeptidyl aminopeptidase/acylaminoacyl peptidase